MKQIGIVFKQDETKVYNFMSDNEAIEVGDLVIVEMQDSRLQIVKVVVVAELDGSETSWVVDRIDMEAHQARK